MRRGLWLGLVWLAAVQMAGCADPVVTEEAVRSFIDEVDNAARRQWPDDICAARSDDFTLRYEERRAASPMTLTRKYSADKAEYCRSLSSFPLVHGYTLVRESLSIKLAADRQSAIVTARYVDFVPDYGDMKPAQISQHPDDYLRVKKTVSEDESVVALDDGELRIRSTQAQGMTEYISKKEFQRYPRQ